MKRPRFTPVPHEVIDVHLKDISGAELKILLMILRKSWGWNRESGSISLSSLEDLTGLSRSTCCVALKSLCEERGLIRKTKLSTEDAGNVSNVYEPVFSDDPPSPEDGPPQSDGSTTPVRQSDQYKEEIKQSYLKQSLIPLPSSEETLKDSDRPEEPFDHEALIRHLLSEKVLLNGRLKGLIRARDFAPGTPLTDAAAVCRREIIPSRFRASGQSRSRTPSDSRSPPMASRYPASPGWTSDCDFCAWDKLYDPEGIFTPADKERAFPYWRDYSDEERIACAEATPRYIRDTDQDYVMRPYNFLKNKEFIRKPKKPKRSKSEMEKEAVLAAFQKARQPRDTQ